MNISIEMDLPESIFSLLRKDRQEMVKMLKLCTAVKLYEMRKISQERASELAGMTGSEFLLALKDFEVSPYPCSADETIEETHSLGFQDEKKWPLSVKKLAGAWKDFPSLEEIRKTVSSDCIREEL